MDRDQKICMYRRNIIEEQIAEQLKLVNQHLSTLIKIQRAKTERKKRAEQKAKQDREDLDLGYYSTQYIRDLIRAIKHLDHNSSANCHKIGICIYHVTKLIKAHHAMTPNISSEFYRAQRAYNTFDENFDYKKAALKHVRKAQDLMMKQA